MKALYSDSTLAVLFEQLAVAHERGIPMAAITSILADDPILKKRGRTRLQSLAATLESGSALATALESAPPIVSEEASHFLRLASDRGESTRALTMLSEDFAIRQRGESIYRLALMWPTAVLAVLGVCFVFNAIFVLPAMEVSFRDAGVELPIGGRLLSALSNTLVGMPIILLLLLAIVAGMATWRRWWPIHVQRRFARVLALLPAARVFFASRLTSQIANVLHNGGEETDLRAAGIRLVGASALGQIHARALEESAARIQTTQSLSEALAPLQKALPRIYLFCRLADTIGDKETALRQLVDLASQEEAFAAARFERTLILFTYFIVGSLVATFVISMYATVASMANLA